MIAALQIYEQFLKIVGSRLIGKTFVLLTVIGLGAVTYLVAAYLMNIPECRETIATFGGKFQRKLAKLHKKS